MDSRIWKVIIAVAALHVLVLGSMFVIQHGCSSRRPSPEVAKAEPAPPIPPMAPSAPAPGSVQALPSTAYAPTPGPGVTPAPVGPVDTMPSTVAPPMASTTKVHTIKKGDTLGQIAKLEGISVNDLLAANPGVDPKKLKIGQEIQVPVGGTETGTAALAPTTSAPKAVSSTYTVKKGDTLAKIAKAQGTTVTAIKKTNKLSSDTIRIGQKLKIPTPTESGQRPPREAMVAAAPLAATGGTVVEAGGTTHIVEAGETPAIIAKKYGITTKALLEANGNPDPRKLKVGQKLVIPGKAGEAAPPMETAPATAPAPAPMESTTPDTTLGVSGTAVLPAPAPAPVESAPAPPVK